MYDNEPFSLFAWKSNLVFDSPLDPGKETLSAWIRVVILDEDEERGLMLVQLPQKTLENGNVFTVRADQVKKTNKSTRQEAR
jgi:hypothetical protein